MTQEQLSLEEFVQSVEGDSSKAKSDPEILTVSALNKQIRNSLEGQYGLVWVKGEISNFKPHSSGHFYFSLKDDNAQIGAVMFKGFNSRLKFKPENGMEVVIRGKITVYEPRGSYQIFCEIMEPVGLGALQMAFEQLKAKLKAEGLFEASRKKPLPFMPRRIAIITSPTGAAIRDMLNVLSRRAKGLQITLIPAVVQGAQAPGDLCRAIALVQQVGGFDVLIVGRGGGSMEDLWGFNDEAVVRAIASCVIPTISAVGHEIDFTIADFVADLRAPTPSAAAELVVKNAADLSEKLRMIQSKIVGMISGKIQLDRRHIQTIEKSLIDPKRKLQDLSIRLDDLMQRLELSAMRSLEAKRQVVIILKHRIGDPSQRLQMQRQKMEQFSTRLSLSLRGVFESKGRALVRWMDVLDSMSPLKVVARGYSIIRKEDELVKDTAQLKKGDRVEIHFAKGIADAVIEDLK
jgi:exodeoxyribonuclease VII large subunit